VEGKWRERMGRDGREKREGEKGRGCAVPKIP